MARAAVDAEQASSCSRVGESSPATCGFAQYNRASSAKTRTYWAFDLETPQWVGLYGCSWLRARLSEMAVDIWLTTGKRSRRREASRRAAVAGTGVCSSAACRSAAGRCQPARRCLGGHSAVASPIQRSRHSGARGGAVMARLQMGNRCGTQSHGAPPPVRPSSSAAAPVGGDAVRGRAPRHMVRRDPISSSAGSSRAHSNRVWSRHSETKSAGSSSVVVHRDSAACGRCLTIVTAAT